MKKLLITLFAIIAITGFGVPMVGAAPVLSFDIDFYGGSTSLVKGELDTDKTITLNAAENDWVMVDVLFSVTESGVPGYGFDLAFNPGTMEADELAIADHGLDSGLSEITPGHVRVEAFVVPFGTFLGPNDGNPPILMATFELHSIDFPGLDDIILYDFDDRAQWITEEGAGLDNQIPENGIYLATVNNVPVPGAVWLLGSGLLGLAGIRSRKKG